MDIARFGRQLVAPDCLYPSQCLAKGQIHATSSGQGMISVSQRFDSVKGKPRLASSQLVKPHKLDINLDDPMEAEAGPPQTTTFPLSSRRRRGLRRWLTRASSFAVVKNDSERVPMPGP